jgi:hypothetical protein
VSAASKPAEAIAHRGSPDACQACDLRVVEAVTRQLTNTNDILGGRIQCGGWDSNPHVPKDNRF